MADHDRHHVINCCALIKGLRHDGYFSDSTYQEALRGLGREGITDVPSRLPASGSKVFLMANIAGVLEDAELLESVCRHYQVFIDRRFLDEVRLGIEEEEDRTELTVWLGQLIDRVRAGLDADVYQSIIIPDDRPRPALEEKEADNPDALSFLTFLYFQPGDSDIISGDDRWFNGHTHRDGVPIIGINEVLRALWHRGYIVSSYDSQVIEDLGIKDLLVTTAFTGDDESRSPQISLLRDPTLASNSLDSFLGGDLSTVLAPCIGHELSSMLASSSLKSMVKEAIQNLKSDSFQQPEWAKIAIVVGNLPM